MRTGSASPRLRRAPFNFAKSPQNKFCEALAKQNGGADGTRTRGLMRDRHAF
jgi:hypothetical protein